MWDCLNFAAFLENLNFKKQCEYEDAITDVSWLKKVLKLTFLLPPIFRFANLNHGITIIIT
jgi:hypothetical protein